VKTRLIPAYGAEGAARIYAQLVERTLKAVTETGATASLWVAGDRAHASVVDWARRGTLPVYSQCEGDLGERMSNCLATLAEQHDRVLLVGTDCPAFTAEHLQAAAAGLSNNCHWVFTPAEDGGYVLVGSNAPGNEPFANIAWSTSEVMAQTRSALQANGLVWAESATLWDIDEPADVERAQSLNLIE
jgi:rSAM/selenodomain-associated transferase 1